MAWKIRFLDKEPEEAQIGDAWLDDGEGKYVFRLSAAYEQHRRAQRAPLIVCLPNPGGGVYRFCVDSAYWSQNDPNPMMNGWQVSGSPENLTISPSVNIGHTYHGWIQNGMISDDCEGRRY